jgi:hypothetical protein
LDGCSKVLANHEQRLSLKPFAKDSGKSY